MKDSTLRELADLNRSALDAVAQKDGCGPTAATVYTRLRSAARRLNQLHRWADAAEFDARFPTVDALHPIRELELRYRGARDQPVEPALLTVEQLLANLAGWSRGVWMAGEVSGGGHMPPRSDKRVC